MLLMCLFGILICGKFKKNFSLLQDLELFLNIFENDVRFKRSPITYIIDGNIHRFKPNFRQLLIQFKSGEKHCGQCELDLICDNFFSSIGHSDATTQLKSIDETKASLTSYKVKVEQEVQRGEMYLKLCAMIGLALFIIVL